MIKKGKVRDPVIAKEENTKLADELDIANKELAFQNSEKAKRAAELIIANKELAFQNEEKQKRAAELVIAKEEKAKRAAELVIAKEEKAKRAAELVIANEEKAKRAAELVIANEEKAKRATELIFANADKAKRAVGFVIANAEKAKRAFELSIANEEKAKREEEFIIADKELVYQNEEKAKRAAEIVIADIKKSKCEAELVIAKIEKAKLLAKSIHTDKELAYQNGEKAKRATELVIANEEKAKRSTELVIANFKKAKRSAELVVANIEKAKRQAEIVIAHKELVYRKSEKAKRKAELIIANIEKAKRSAELAVANLEKSKRAAELVLIKKELVLAKEKEKLVAELTLVNKELTHQIVKRKQTELALKESNEKYSKAFQSSPYAITLSRLEDGGYIEVNDTFVSMSGFSRKEALSNSAIGLNLWVDKEKRNSVISALLSGKKVKGKEFQFRKKSGEIMTGLFSATIIDINEEHCMLSSIDNITERRKSENLLKESENKAILIMENSADAIFVANQKGEYMSTNKEVSAMLGYTSEEMKSKTIAELTDPSKHEEIFKIFNQVLSEGKIYAEIELLKKDGNFISTDLNAVLLPDGTVYGSCRDITERKMAESELIRAKEKAEESNRLKTAFLQNISHEIRTPMNGILGFSELLKEPNLTHEQQQRFLKLIGESGARMLNTINDIVDISKIEAGLVNVYSLESDINKHVESLHQFFAPLAERKGLQLSFNNGLPSNEAIIKTDSRKINSILTNLVGNAIKFTDEGSIEFGYKKNGEYLDFFVKDTGIGIPKDRLDAIFERFIQADIEDKRAFQGCGLGLTISKTYVEILGGKIWVESQEDLGSTFYFTLPYETKSEINEVFEDEKSD